MGADLGSSPTTRINCSSGQGLIRSPRLQIPPPDTLLEGEPNAEHISGLEPQLLFQDISLHSSRGTPDSLLLPQRSQAQSETGGLPVCRNTRFPAQLTTRPGRPGQASCSPAEWASGGGGPRAASAGEEEGLVEVPPTGSPSLPLAPPLGSMVLCGDGEGQIPRPPSHCASERRAPLCGSLALMGSTRSSHFGDPFSTPPTS